MSYAEIIQEVEQLEPAECERLADHLRLMALLRDPEYMAEMERRFEEMERGVNVVPSSEILERFRQLKAAPRP